MNVEKLTTEGEADGSFELPDVFDTPYRPDLIHRAFLAAQANEKQDYGADPFAGKRASAESPGKGRGIAQVPRLSGSSRAAFVPHAEGGRRAHPPKAEKDRTENFNTKESKKAFRSAVAATADAELVADRGHDFDDTANLPVVAGEGFENLVKTKEVVTFLENVGLHDDIVRADEGRSVRAGRGTTRGRKHRTPTSILFVTDGEFRAARNLPGADVVRAETLGVHHLAPGGNPGRLTVWTEPAIEVIEER